MSPFPRLDKETIRPPVTLPVPTVEFDRVYQGERVQVRVWDEIYSPIAEIQWQTVAYAGLAIEGTGLAIYAGMSLAGMLGSMGFA